VYSWGTQSNGGRDSLLSCPLSAGHAIVLPSSLPPIIVLQLPNHLQVCLFQSFFTCVELISYDMIYLLNATGLPPSGSSTVHIYTQTIHRMTQNKQYIEQHKNFGRAQAVPLLCGLYPGICLTIEEKARKNLSQGSRKVPAGMMKIHKHTIRIDKHTIIINIQ